MKTAPLLFLASALILLVGQAAGQQTWLVLGCPATASPKPFANLVSPSAARDRVCSALLGANEPNSPALWTDLVAAQPAVSLVQSTAFSWGQGTAPALGAGGTAIAKPQLSSVAVTLDPSTPLAPEVLTLVMSGRSTPTAFIFTTAGGSTGGTSGTGSNTSPTAPTSLWRLTNVFVWNATTTVTSGVRPTYKLDIVSQSASYRVWTFDSTGAAVRYPIPTCFSATAGTTTSADTC